MEKIIERNGGRVIFNGDWQHDGFYWIEADGGTLVIEPDVFIASGTKIVCHDSIYIGRSCMFAENCVIRDSDHQTIYDPNTFMKHMPNVTSPVVIEDGCWIASGVTILKGNHLGKGCVIGAGSVVTHDVPAYAIVAGVPAKVIKYRPGYEK